MFNLKSDQVMLFKEKLAKIRQQRHQENKVSPLDHGANTEAKQSSISTDASYNCCPATSSRKLYIEGEYREDASNSTPKDSSCECCATLPSVETFNSFS